MERLRTGIVGLGKMGRHHARCVVESVGLELAGIADVDPDKSRAAPPEVPFVTNADELFARCDAIVLAVPTDRHEEIATAALSAGKHVLVEKPLAADVASCERIRDVALAHDRVLGVGHVERMNGAFRAVRDHLEGPRFVEGHRLAAYDPRGTEVDVVLDLMIHDLDLVLQAFGDEPVSVEAVGVPVVSDRVDIANARLEFPSGALVNLTASRVSREPIRKLRFFQADAYLSIDFQSQSAEVVRRDESAAPFGVSIEKHETPSNHNPLVLELEAFAAAVAGRESPMPTAEEGTRAVALARRVLDSIDERRRAWSPESGKRGTPWSDPS